MIRGSNYLRFCKERRLLVDDRSDVVSSICKSRHFVRTHLMLARILVRMSKKSLQGPVVSVLHLVCAL